MLIENNIEYSNIYVHVNIQNDNVHTNKQINTQTYAYIYIYKRTDSACLRPHNIFIHIYMRDKICIYIYIYMRAKKTVKHGNIYTCIYMHKYTGHICIYELIYIFITYSLYMLFMWFVHINTNRHKRQHTHTHSHTYVHMVGIYSKYTHSTICIIIYVLTYLYIHAYR